MIKNFFKGFQIIDSIWRGESDIVQGNDSRMFPRLTICDVRTREIGQDHVYSIQCILSFNMFNERMYAFIWMWIFLILIPFAIMDIGIWINRVIFRGHRYRYRFIKKRLDMANYRKNTDRHLLKLFCEKYCGMDGIFILRLLEHNSNAAVVYDLINKMWISFKNDHEK